MTGKKMEGNEEQRRQRRHVSGDEPHAAKLELLREGKQPSARHVDG